MRWIWIDKFIAFDSGKRAVAVKCCTLAEDHLYDVHPDFPTIPHSLIVEGIAQTAGMLVGEVRDFREKVVLAKVGRASFTRLVRPGETVEYHVTMEQFSDAGASIRGVALLQGTGEPVAEVDLMFSHIDHNFAGATFPKDNFVFTTGFLDLLTSYRRTEAAIKL